MPRIEEYSDGQGYRFTWEAITSHKTRLFCIVYTWNTGSISELLLEVCSAPCDVLTAPMEQVRSVLAWLKTLPDPEKEEVTMLSESTMDAMSQCNTPAAWFFLVWLRLEEFVSPPGTGARGPWHDLSRLVHLLTGSAGCVLATDRA